MQDYSVMSDFEINKAVAFHMGLSMVIIAENGKYGEFDPCGNPADAWPIVTSNLIGVEPIYQNGTKWLAHAGDDSEFRCVDTSSLRAAMIVYLQMMEQKS